MNTPSPLVPQGSLHQQTKKKVTFPVAVFTIFSLHILVIGVMLIQGCNRNVAKKGEDTGIGGDTNNSLPTYIAPTNNVFAPANPNIAIPPVAPTNFVTSPAGVPASTETFAQPVKMEAPATPEGKDYTVAKGDTLGKIARKQGVALSALKKANPGVEPTKLKVGQKLKIPGGTTTTAEDKSTTAAAGADSGEGATYAVKAGDTLTKIARAHGTTARKLRAFNNLSTDKLKVGQKLKIPAGGAGHIAAAKPESVNVTTNDAAFSNTIAPAAVSTNGLR